MKDFASEYPRNEDGLILSYMAGIVDGEGNISLLNKPKTRQIQLRLSIANTSLELIEWIQNKFTGGKLYEHKMYSIRHKQRYDWVATGQEAKKIIKLIKPYLVVKSRQADIALQFPILTPGILHNDIIHQNRLMLVDDMRELNKSGK